jgi:hypothetical protein
MAMPRGLVDRLMTPPAHLRLSSRAASFLAILFLLLLPPVFFWRETLGRVTLADQDAVFWFYPIYALVAEQLRAGHLPLWNPLMYSGTPLFAQWQAGVLDPLNWIYLLSTSSRAMTIAQEASFALALLATFGYTRRLGLTRRASVVAAVIYALSGFAVARTIYPGLLHIVALTPLVLYFIERLAQRGRWRDAIGGALIVAWQIFAAHPQPFLYSSLLAAGYVLFCGFLRRREPDARAMFVSDTATSDGEARLPAALHRWRFLGQCAVMFAAGVLLAAVQLIPAWEFVSQSVRQRVPYEFFTLHSLHPLTLLTTLFPFFHGQGKAIYHLPYWGPYWHSNEAQIYLGVLALSLAAAGAFYAWRERSRVGMFWSFAAVAGVMLSLGKYAGPVAWMLYRVPVLSDFRSPNRHWMEVTLAIAVLAGYAVDRLLRQDARAVARPAQIIAGLLTAGCCLVGAFVLWRKDLAEAIIRALPDLGNLPRGFLQPAGAEFYLPMISAMAALVMLLVFTSARRRQRWYGLLLALLLVDFHLYAAFAPINNPDKLEALIGKAMPEALVDQQNERAPPRYHVVLNPAAGEFNPYWFYGYEMATGYDPLVSTRYKTFSGIDEAGRSHLQTMLDARDRTLDLLNVRYLLVAPQFLGQLAAGSAPTAAGSKRIELGGIAFADDQSSAVDLRAGQQASFSADEGIGEALAIVSALANAAEVADGEEVAEIVIGCGPGERWTASLRAGRETAEWAYERADVRTRIRHARAPVAENYPGDASASFEAHSYLARITLPPEVASCGSARFVQISSKARGQVALSLKRLAFYDSASGRSVPLRRTVTSPLTDVARWRELPMRSSVPAYQGFRIYENLRALPRVWLTERVVPLAESEQLRLIHGRMADAGGQVFDPLSTALVEPDVAARLDQALLKPSGDSAGVSEKEPDRGWVKIVSRQPAAIVMEAEAARPTMLVLSEITFPGWRAKVDGQETELWRVNYLLRGVALTPGRHRVELVYWPRSLLVGAAVSIVTALGLLLSGLRSRRRS